MARKKLTLSTHFQLNEMTYPANQPAPQTARRPVIVTIETNIPKVKTKTKVWRSFLKYSELNTAKALLAITPGNSPEVHFDIMPRANGKFSGSRFPNRVYLAKAICDKFERSDSKNSSMHILIE